MSLKHRPGEIIQDRYRITGVLGQGGVAITYSAVNLQREFTVAIKVISLKQLDNWKQIELFKREAEVLAKLDHPAIPRYIDYFDIETARDKAFYIVQQQAPGKSLAQLVESGWRTNEEEVKNIAQQVLEILTYLHSLDPPVIHRDIKPNNIIYSDDGKIYLVDFGAVQNTYYNTLMQGSTVVGTYGYMAPEQFRGQALPATDLYSLGATLLYLLTHRSPAELPQDTLKLDFRNSVDISENFADWLEKILEPDLDDRFTNAELALAKLFASKKKKQKKLITSIVTGVLSISLIAGINSYRWGLLGHLGFYPSNLCSEKMSLKNYLNKGGKINFITNNLWMKKEIINCVLESEGIENNTKTEVIERIIEKGAELNISDLQGKTLLSNAVIKNNIEIVKLLIESGANLNIQDINGKNPLFYAVIRNNIEIVKLLIESGADLNIQDGDGKIPAFDAVLTNNIEMVKLLIESGADLNIQDGRRRTPVFYAVKTNNIEIVKLLIKTGANLNIQDRHWKTPIFNAVHQENIEIVKLLIKNGANLNIRDKQDRTPVFYAAKTNNIEIVKLLIKTGVALNIQDEYGKTPLFNAISEENTEIVRLLIKNSVALNIQDKYGKTPLFNAVKTNNIEIVKLLVESGADLNIQGNNPLFNAVEKNNIEIVKLLIKGGANINIQGKYGNNPLFYAIYEENIEIVKLLINTGVNINLKDKYDKTSLFYAVVTENAEIVKLLIKTGANINIQDKYGKTPLFHAVSQENIEIVKILLIKTGAYINAQNNYGQTYLSLAAVQENIELIKLLIDNGADTSNLDYQSIRKAHELTSTEAQKVKIFLTQYNLM